MTSKGSLMAMLRILLTTTVFLWCAMTLRAAEGLSRWAIVASPEVQKSGLADVVWAEASTLDRLEFVERSELDRVAKELELESLAGADGVAQRINAGRVLQADVLVLLKTVSKSESNPLRVVICDTRQGARLASFETVLNKATFDQTAKSVVAEMARVRSHFAEGIRLVVGVTPFVSRNLEHRHDHWQSRFAELLTNSLASQRGVAVIEVEEARAILKERSLRAEEAVARRVPFIVSGQFRMTSRDGATEPDVELEIELTTAKSAKKLQARTFALSRAPQWLVGDFSRELLKSTGEAFEPLAADVQRIALIKQADSFGQLGDWLKSLGLREAGLVLAPDNVEQRVQLILDYQLCFTRDFDRLWSYKKVVGEDRALLLEQAADQFISAQEHLEFLIRNRRIGRDEALRLFRRQRWEGPGAGALVNRLPGNDAVELSRFERVLDAEQQFITDTFLGILKLPEAPTLPAIIQPLRHEFDEPWWTSLLARVANHVRSRRFNEHGLKFMTLALTQIVPEDMPYPEPLYHLANDGRALNTDEQKAEWKKFLTEMAQAKQTAARFFGRAQLWELSWRQSGGLGRSDRETLIAFVRDADAILSEFNGRRVPGDMGMVGLRGGRDTIQKYLDRTPNSTSPADAPVRGSLGRLRFQPLQWTVTTSADHEQAEVPIFESMCRCGEALDVYWTKKILYFMNRPGELRALPIQGHPDWSRRGAFSHVTWDGECVWLVVAGRGIFVLNPQGDVVTQFTNETPMPGIEAGVQMLPLAPRRMLVAGSIGEHHRAWCGILEVSAKHQPSVRVFHESTRVAGNRTLAEANNDIDTAFQPMWIQRLEGRNGRPMVLVGRSRQAKSLAIDLDSLTTSLAEFYPRGFPSNDAYFRKNGYYVQIGTTGVYEFKQLESGALADEKELLDHRYPWAKMLLVGDRAFVTGPRWWSIDTTTRQVEALLPDKAELPNPYRTFRYGVSAHYGLLGFRPYVPPQEAGAPTVFQITIADEAMSSKSQ